MLAIKHFDVNMMTVKEIHQRRMTMATPDTNERIAVALEIIADRLESVADSLEILKFNFGEAECDKSPMTGNCQYANTNQLLSRIYKRMSEFLARDY